MKNDQVHRGKVTLEKPRKFTESTYLSYLVQCMAEGKYAEAEQYFLDTLKDLQTCKIHRKEKLNNLHYLTRLLQRKGGKHGHEKLLRKAKGLHKRIGNFGPPRGGVFVELGCGAHDPTALAAYHYVNGFSHAYSIDLLEPRNAMYSGLSMYGMLANMLAFPQRYVLPGVSEQDLVERVRRFNLEALECGEFWEGLAPVADELRYEQCDFTDSTVAPNSVGILASFAVLEHVSDLDSICQRIFESMLPGGIVYHFIDLADHRSYRPTGEFNALSFLADDGAPKGVNRIRASQHVAAQQRAGFELLINDVVRTEISADVAKNMLPQFRAMESDDVCVIKQRLVLRRPS